MDQTITLFGVIAALIASIGSLLVGLGTMGIGRRNGEKLDDHTEQLSQLKSKLP